MIKHIFEAVDATNDEMYYPIGAWETLEDALAALDGKDPSDLDDFDQSQDGSFTVEIRKRKIGYCDHGHAVHSINWRWKDIEADDIEWVREDHTPKPTIY